MSDDTLILTIACQDNEAPIMISQVEYDRLRLIAQKALALARADDALNTAIQDLHDAIGR